MDAMTNTTMEVPTEIPTEDTLLVKIAALLRKAESTDNEHEAEAFTAKAQQLATLAQIDVATARSYVPAHERKELPTTERIRIGEAGKVGLATFVELFLQIGRANDVVFNIASNSTYVVAFGFPSDIATTKALYASLVTQMVEASNVYIKSGAYKTETVWREYKDEWGDRRWGYKPVSGRTARISFQEAFAYRIGRRLREARDEAVASAAKAAQEMQSPYLNDRVAQPSSVALVLKSKADEVKAHYDAHSDARGSWKGGSSKTRSSSAQNAGLSAANSARLGAPRALGGSRGSLRG